MSNIKLKDHNWATDGIYDTVQGKTQKAINEDIADVTAANENLVLMKNTQPTETGNKLWIKAGTSYSVPVMADLTGANIANDSSNVSGLTVTDALDTLDAAIDSIGSGDIANESTKVSGTTVSDALNNLQDEVNPSYLEQGQLSATVGEAVAKGTNAARVRTSKPIPWRVGDTITVGVNYRVRALVVDKNNILKVINSWATTITIAADTNNVDPVSVWLEFEYADGTTSIVPSYVAAAIATCTFPIIGVETNSTLDLKSAVSKDNMSANLFYTHEAAEDLNSAKKGYLVFNTTTSNRPSGANYGVVLTHQGSTWKYQTAVDTNGAIYRRKNINDAGWTQWVSSQSEKAQFLTNDALKKSRFVCLGDSYAAGWTNETGTVEANGWPQQVRTKLGISNSDFFSDYLGGVGFAQAINGVTIASMVNSVSVTDPSTIDYVILCCGYNDKGYTDAQVETGIQNAVTNAKSRFPNARICIGFIGMTYANHNDYVALVKRKEVYEGCAQTYGYTYLRNIEVSLYSDDLMSAYDLYHPNATGNQKIAEGIIRCLNNGYNNICESGYKTYTALDNATIASGGTSVFWKIKDDTMTISWVSTNFQRSNESSSSNWHSLNKYHYPLINLKLLGMMAYEFEDSVTKLYVTREYSSSDSGEYRIRTGYLTRANICDLNWVISGTNDAGNNYLSIGITEIQIPPFTLTAKMFSSSLV